MTSLWKRSTSFARVPIEDKDEESVENLLPSSPGEWTYPQPQKRRRHLWTALNVLLFLFSMTVLSYQVYITYRERHEMNYLIKKTSFFSPILDKVNIPTYVSQNDGSLFAPEDTNPFRNNIKPDPNVEAAWKQYDSIRTFPISRADVVKLGKDPELTVKYPAEYGLGDEAYIAQLDIFHQIHCLNLLRHLAWAEYDRDGVTPKRPYSELHWVHVGHCTDMLMQNLLCQGSTDVLTFNWLETEEWPFPDFFVNRQCRDFDTIARWQEDNALPLMMGRNISRPASGYKEIPLPKEYWVVFPDGLNDELHG